MKKSPIFIIFKALQSLSFPKLAQLFGLFFRHPLFAILSFHATQRAFIYARKNFPKTHANDGKGNAFRHAYWCCLILMYCCKVSSPKKSLAWCKKITDMHEELFPNEPLQKMMDLHNNKVGMEIFMEMLSGVHRQFFERNFFPPILHHKLKTAEKLTDIHQKLGKELVYLND